MHDFSKLILSEGCHEPFELGPVDFVLDELEEGCKFRPRTHVGRSVFDKIFLEPRRSRKYDINLEKVDSLDQPGAVSRDAFIFSRSC